MKKSIIHDRLLSIFILVGLLIAGMPTHAMQSDQSNKHESSDAQAAAAPLPNLPIPIVAPRQQNDMSRESALIRGTAPIAQCAEFACQRTLSAPVGAQVLGGAGLCFFGTCLTGYGCCMSCGAGCAGAAIGAASGIAKQQENGGVLPATAEFWIGPKDTKFYGKKIRQIFNAICGLVGVSPIEESPDKSQVTSVHAQERRQLTQAGEEQEIGEEQKESEHERKIIRKKKHQDHAFKTTALRLAKIDIKKKAIELEQEHNPYLDAFECAQNFESLRIALENMPHGHEGQVLRKGVIEVTVPLLLEQAQTCGDVLLLMPLADSMSSELAARVMCKGRDLLRQPSRVDTQQGVIREATVNVRDEAKLMLLMLYNTLAHIANRGDDALTAVAKEGQKTVESLAKKGDETVTSLATRADAALAAFIKRGDDLLANTGNELKFASRGVIGILYGTSACLIGGGAYLSIGALRMLQNIILTILGKNSSQSTQDKEMLKKITKQLEHLQEQIDKKATTSAAVSQPAQEQAEAKNMNNAVNKAAAETTIEKDTTQSNPICTDKPEAPAQTNDSGALKKWGQSLANLRRWPTQKANN